MKIPNNADLKIILEVVEYVEKLFSSNCSLSFFERDICFHVKCGKYGYRFGLNVYDLELDIKAMLDWHYQMFYNQIHDEIKEKK